MAAPPKKLTPAFAALVAVWLAAACDPNVVIGARHSLAIAGGSDDVAGVGGAGGSGGVNVAGDAVMPVGGTAGDSTGVGAGAAGVAGADTNAAGAAGDAGVLFSANHETGNLAQWDAGADDDAGGYYADDALPAYSTAQQHTGSGSAKTTIDTSGGERISRLYRRIDAQAAYYSAWFYLAEDHTPESWWSIFLFRAVQLREASIDLWSVDLVRTADKSKLTVAVYDHQYGTDGRTIEVPSQPIVPVGAWFNIEAYLSVQTDGSPSKLTLWLDGHEFLTLDPATPAPQGQPLYWVVGNGGGTLAPPRSTVYVDDAQISTSFIQP